MKNIFKKKLVNIYKLVNKKDFENNIDIMFNTIDTRNNILIIKKHNK